jgi:hypothetical protein
MQKQPELAYLGIQYNLTLHVGTSLSANISCPTLAKQLSKCIGSTDAICG